MSYVLHFWSFPLPQTLADADRIQAELSRKGGAPHPQAAALAQALHARFPPCSAFDDDEDPRLVWLDDSLERPPAGPLISAGVIGEYVHQVVPPVVEIATSLGFVVFDEQAGECHLPGGWTLRHAGRTIGQHLGRLLDAPLTMAQAEPAVMQALESVLAGHGFRNDPMAGGLWRKTGTVTHLITWKPLGGTGGTLVFDIEVWFVSDEMRKPWLAHEETYALASGRPKGRYKASARTTFSRLALFGQVSERIVQQHELDTRFRVDAPDDLRRVAWLVRLIADDWLLKVLDKSLDLDHLSFWMHDPKPATWRTLKDRTGGVERSVQRHLLDTVGCGGPAASLLLAWASECPDLEWVRRDERARVGTLPTAERAEAQLRLDLVERALREAGR